MTDSPVLLFFAHSKEFDSSSLQEHFDRIVRDFVSMHRDDIATLKAVLPVELMFRKPVFPNFGIVADSAFSPPSVPFAGSHAQFYGIRTWQPSFAYTHSKRSYHILQFNQAFWDPDVYATATRMADPETRDALKNTYLASVGFFFDSLQMLRPHLSVFLHNGEPIALRFREPSDLLAYYAYSEGLTVTSDTSQELVRTTELALKHFSSDHPVSYHNGVWTLTIPATATFEALTDFLHQTFSNPHHS